MFPPAQHIDIDARAISGITGFAPIAPRTSFFSFFSLDFFLIFVQGANGCLHPARSISIACWIVVFSPQIIANVCFALSANFGGTGADGQEPYSSGEDQLKGFHWPF